MIVVVTITKEDGKVVAGPDIISRGFVYVRESEDLMDEAREVVREVLDDCEQQNIREWSLLKGSIRDSLKDFYIQKNKTKANDITDYNGSLKINHLGHLTPRLFIFMR